MDVMQAYVNHLELVEVATAAAHHIYDNLPQETKNSLSKLMNIFYGVWLCVEAGKTLEETIASFDHQTPIMIETITDAYNRIVED